MTRRDAPHRRRGALRRLLVVASAVLTAAPLYAQPAAASPGPRPGDAVSRDAASSDAAEADVSMERVRVRAVDHVELDTRVYRPLTPGPRPLLVVPGAWFSLPHDTLAHRRRLRDLAASGYVVVSYEPRGFRTSGGHVDMAGPRDVADVSRMIDWALAHTAADPDAIGLFASSYGAAVALNAAAADPRVKAVAALSPWTDLRATSWHNGVRATTMGTFQELIGRLNGRLSEETAAAYTHLHTGSHASDAWARVRSPHTHLPALNAHRTAVLLVNEWDDPLVPAGQTGAFLDALRGPKRLFMMPGGHGDSTSPASDLVKPTGLWQEAARWLDRHVRGHAPARAARGPVRHPVVTVRPRTGGPDEHYASWSELHRATRAVRLVEPRQAPTAYTLVAGVPSAAESGPPVVAGMLDGFAVRQATSPHVLLPPAAAVWTSAPFGERQRLRGAPVVTVRLASTAARGSVVAHLYDVDGGGSARLITHAPAAFAGRPPGRDVTLRIPLTATAWDVPAGHRLAVVIDTVDHRYAAENPLGARIRLDAAATRLSAPITRHGRR
ncbi:alpha/beta fold hydrolase [Streptomyces sp. URMC 123]|uniref:alpha/beta fold hydrolase n=1 Tax=Streptomyces sp. URMC 123 TaxID=3423403 RepID=UPI003F1A39C9